MAISVWTLMFSHFLLLIVLIFAAAVALTVWLSQRFGVFAGTGGVAVGAVLFTSLFRSLKKDHRVVQ